MASFKVKTRSSFTVFSDEDSFEAPINNSYTVKQPSKVKLGPNADKENFDPVRKVYLNKLAKKEMTQSVNIASTSKTPNNPTRYKSENNLTPSPLADITEAHDQLYHSPLPLSISYTTENLTKISTKLPKATGKLKSSSQGKDILFRSTHTKSASTGKRSSELASPQPRKLSRSNRETSKEGKSKSSTLHFRL
ncbi:hypothetical protein K7432_016586 [Basidiobolus ranarum]|uniref:Uncharacterized protein n=1 Tax=Basidiobolus ranarum TaxID=34480 RepID=A0ABR2WEI2_9FUNG